MIGLKLQGPTPTNEMIGGAVFSEDDKYRYMLSRDWDDNDKIVIWILLNPSTGDDKVLERTTAGCLSRSKSWGFGAMLVLNLFALVSTDPANLKTEEDPIGRFNDNFISLINNHAPENATFIAGWGNNGSYLNRDKEVSKLLIDRDLYCLGINKDGSPKHPLHLSHSIRPELWCGAGDIHLWS